MRQTYQSPKVQDLGTQWKIVYWDYSSVPRIKRSKCWSKRRVPTSREAKQLADQFMEQVNKYNNRALDPNFREYCLSDLAQMCRERTWPLLKNSTRISYSYLLDKHLLPGLGKSPLEKLRTADLQDFFNRFHPRLSPKSIRLIHSCLRSVLGQGLIWGMLEHNPAIGVRLPRRKPRKNPVLLERDDIRRLIEALPEPTRSMVILMVLGSMRVGEVQALRWSRLRENGIEVSERFYAGEFDDTKTEAGKRIVPYDRLGIMNAALEETREHSAYRAPNDLVFSNNKGGPIDRHNLLNRQLKPTLHKLGLPHAVDFRSFRTMHASLMSSAGVRPEVTRDNMGHSTIDVTQNIYGKTWFDERESAVTKAAALVFPQPKAALSSVN